ncbi:hypothetical protein HanIR_Chr17g0859961 [Helianthus annuus]|nr:hypothetical protein HanIR_Chr17g0859961 [Helianthus annuus]
MDCRDDARKSKLETSARARDANSLVDFPSKIGEVEDMLSRLFAIWFRSVSVATNTEKLTLGNDTVAMGGDAVCCGGDVHQNLTRRVGTLLVLSTF